MNTSENFWEHKSPNSKEVLFADPLLLWEAANDFFKSCMDNPITSCQSSAKKKWVAKIQPFTLRGFCYYISCTVDSFAAFKKELLCRKDNLTETDQAFLDVIARIEEVIYLQNYNYAAVGFLNSRIISLQLGLEAKKTKPEPKPLIFKFVD